MIEPLVLTVAGDPYRQDSARRIEQPELVPASEGGVLKSPDNGLVRVSSIGLCHRCVLENGPPKKRHHALPICNPFDFDTHSFNWFEKHKRCELETPGCVQVVTNRREFPAGFDDRVFSDANKAPWWLDWQHNANVVQNYIADAAITMDLSALAASATFVAGREGTWVTNSSGYENYRLSGNIISGTTPTVPAEHRLCYLSATEDTPAYPDVFDGTDSAETITNTNIRDSLIIGWSGTASATSNITYPITSALTLEQAFGVAPKHWGVFFSHAHTAALKTDAGNTNSIFYQGLHRSI